MPITQIDSTKMYWWNVSEGMRVLVRVQSVNTGYAVIYLLTATPDEVLLVGHGVGERFQVLREKLLLEKAG